MSELETFNHSISHDLRTPVGAVLNYSALIEEDYGTQLDEKGVRMVRGIRASAESAAGLLDQLIQLGWAGRERRERLLVDMTALARDVHAELVAAGAEADQVHFEVRELPPVWGSAALLRCVMRNLFSNSIKYTRGRPERRVQVEGAAGEHENAYWITDNGIGFDPALAEAVFQPFRRFAHGGRYEGSGLGLAIAARIVRRHGGRIWGESDGVNGARFCFTIPSNGDAG
jgi:signal transduction histidine kinase